MRKTTLPEEKNKKQIFEPSELLTSQSLNLFELARVQINLKAATFIEECGEIFSRISHEQRRCVDRRNPDADK